MEPIEFKIDGQRFKIMVKPSGDMHWGVGVYKLQYVFANGEGESWIEAREEDLTIKTSFWLKIAHHFRSSLEIEPFTTNGRAFEYYVSVKGANFSPLYVQMNITAREAWRVVYREYRLNYVQGGRYR